MAEKHLDGVAEKIADVLLTVGGSGPESLIGTRLQVMQKQRDGTERNLGGRNRACLVREITQQLIAAGIGEQVAEKTGQSA